MRRKCVLKKSDVFWSAFLILPWLDVPSGLPGKYVDEWKKKVKEWLRELRNSDKIPLSQKRQLIRKIKSGDFSGLDLSEWLKKDD